MLRIQPFSGRYGETVKGLRIGGSLRSRDVSNVPTRGIGAVLGIFEFLEIDDDIRKLILGKKDSNIIKEMARKKGMRTLREDGWLKVKQGMTTIPEVLRVTQEEQVLVK